MIEPTERASAQELLTECEFLTGSAMSSAASTGVLLASAAATAAVTAAVIGVGNIGGKSSVLNAVTTEAQPNYSSSQHESPSSTPRIPM